MSDIYHRSMRGAHENDTCTFITILTITSYLIACVFGPDLLSIDLYLVHAFSQTSHLILYTAHICHSPPCSSHLHPLLIHHHPSHPFTASTRLLCLFPPTTFCSSQLIGHPATAPNTQNPVATNWNTNTNKLTMPNIEKNLTNSLIWYRSFWDLIRYTGGFWCLCLWSRSTVVKLTGALKNGMRKMRKIWCMEM